MKKKIVAKKLKSFLIFFNLNEKMVIMRKSKKRTPVLWRSYFLVIYLLIVFPRKHNCNKFLKNIFF